MKKSLFYLLSFFVSLPAFAQLNMSYISNVTYNEELSDIWGYVAPDSTEYALVGVFNGVSIINLSDPANPVESAYLAGVGSGWRDVKTFGEYAYVINETSNGLMVIDLTDLPNSATAFDWTPQIDGLGTLSSCHNIYIDEFGYAYLVGCNLNSGGMLYVDVFTEPGNPIYVDAGPSTYSHDVFVRDNIAYCSEINQGNLTIYDVSDKSNTTTEGQTSTPAEFTHNAWPSDDGNYVFTTDEVANAPVAVYDISDLSDIQELDQFRPLETLGDGVIPHNTHVWQDWLIVSYYTDGCLLVDASHPDNLVEVGNFDTFIPASTGFSGAWGAYPFLPSGLVLVSDIGNGMYVLEPNYVYAAYLEGNVKNADTGADIIGADITILTTNVIDQTNISGDYKTGYAISGTYDVMVDHPLYEAQTAQAVLENGEVTILNFELIPLPSFTFSGTVIDMETGNPFPNAQVKITGGFEDFIMETSPSGDFSLNPFVEGEYTIYAGAWGYKQVEISNLTINDMNNSITIQLEKGLEDGFELDLGWTTSGNNFTGDWERGVPIGIDAGGGGVPYFVTPFSEDSTDIGNSCWVTGNDSDLINGVLIGGSAILTSPYFDLTEYVEPHITFNSWYLNATSNGTNLGADDKLYVRLTNGSAIINLDTLEQAPGSILGTPPSWEAKDFDLTGLIPFTDSMQIFFEASTPDDFTSLIEAAIDYFTVYEAFIVNTTTVENKIKFKAFPNPSTYSITIDYELEEKGTLVIYNALGQIMETIPLNDLQGRIQVGANWTPGIYPAKIIGSNQSSKSIKLVKQ